MNKSEAKSLENMFNSVVDSMKQMSGAMKLLNQRITRLEAENKELRNLWAECEKDCVEQKVRLDDVGRLLATQPKPKERRDR